MAGFLAVGGILALTRPAFAAPVLEQRVASTPATTITSAAALTASVVPHSDVTSHGPYTGPSPTTTGAQSTSVLAASVPALPPNPAKFDYQSIALGLYQEWIELDLFHYGLATYSDEDFEAAGLTGEDRYLLQFMAEQEVGHATLLTNMLGDNAPKQCTYNYPSMNVREYVDFSQKLTRWGESGVYGFLNHLDAREVGQLLLQSITTEARQQMIFRQFNGQFPMPVWFECGIPQSWAWTLLAPYISSCPEGTQQLIWQNFPALHVLNQPNAARTDGADVWNETRGDYANTLSTDGIAPEDACAGSDAVGEDCSPAITHNRTRPLSYPGREVFLQWEEPGQAVGPNNSYVASTSAGAPRFALWASQLNVTYSPLLNVSGNSAYTIQPNVSTYEGDPAINGTMFLALTDEDLYVTPFNLSSVNPHVYALALYQAG